MHLLIRDSSQSIHYPPSSSLLVITPSPLVKSTQSSFLSGFQEGEIITFCLLGFALFLIFSVVIYYKCIAPSLEVRSRVVFNPKENRRISQYGKELFGKFVKKNNY